MTRRCGWYLSSVRVPGVTAVVAGIAGARLITVLRQLCLAVVAAAGWAAAPGMRAWPGGPVPSGGIFRRSRLWAGNSGNRGRQAAKGLFTR